jgi:hypothetical protein
MKGSRDDEENVEHEEEINSRTEVVYDTLHP